MHVRETQTGVNTQQSEMRVQLRICAKRDDVRETESSFRLQYNVNSTMSTKSAYIIEIRCAVTGDRCAVTASCMSGVFKNTGVFVGQVRVCLTCKVKLKVCPPPRLSGFQHESCRRGGLQGY